MSFDKPTSEIYFLTVPFSPDLKNVIKFSSREEQQNAFIGLAGKHFTNLNIIRKNRPLIIKGDFGDYYRYNYIMFKNPELSDKWWYAFITDSNYLGSGSTEINFVIDPWQTFQFNITYYKCMIERGIVKRDDDNYKKWTQSEPFNVTPFHTSGNLNIHNNKSLWEPRYILETTTYPFEFIDVTTGEVKSPRENGDYTYGGSGNVKELPDSDSSVVWGLQLEGKDIGIGNDGGWYKTYSHFIKLYSNDTVSHINDILNIRVIPKWMYDNIKFQSVTNILSFAPNYIKENVDVETKESDCIYFLVKNDELENGYIPRNHKMLSSLCRTYLLYNENGFNKQFLPEYIDSGHMSIYLSAKPIGLTTIFGSTQDYQLKHESYFTINYNLELFAGFNSNVGIQKALSVFQASRNVVSSSTNLLSDFLNLPKSLSGTPDKRYKSGVRPPTDLQIKNYENSMISSGIGIVNDTFDLIGSGISLAQSLGAVTYGKSTTNDHTMYSPDHINIKVVEINPSVTECEVIDDFLDRYGYTINELGYPNTWSNTRSNWNYVKTADCNLKVSCSALYEQQIRDMFNAGVTIWHGLDKYGKYNTKTNGVWSDINK